MVTMAAKTALVGLDPTQLEELAVRLGEPAYRGTQLARWIYARGAADLGAMTDLPKTFRDRVVAEHPVGALSRLHLREDADGTRKFVFTTATGGTVESVLMPYDRRLTACVSVQVGCAVACAFCATGQSGFQRHLTAGEIVEQVLQMQREAGERVTNVVFMGMGEPMLNYEPVMAAVRLLNEEVGIAMRHLTLSTSGVVPGMDRLAEARLQLTLAVSIHAPTDALRDWLVPINKTYPLAVLHDAMQRYATATGRRLTVEYVMLEGVNDAEQQARELACYLRGVHCQVNLIPYHATDAAFRCSPMARMKAFRKVLQEAGFPTTIRQDKGVEIVAACGQLRRTLEKGA